MEEIKRRLDIADVIGSYIQLKPAGRNRKAVCPFHQEKTPSFMVSPEKGIWHCFGCEQGGDVFGFVMKMEGVEFRDALEMLAQKAGVELKPRTGSGKTKEQKQRLLAAAAEAVRYYQETLIKNRKALEYLIKERGLAKETLKSFAIGYAPDSWDALTKYLIGRKFSETELVKAGLATQSRGGLRDLFRSRIMLPVSDTQGRPVGFSGRLLNESAGGPKYLNTPQTLLYDKSRLLYGWHLARDAVRENDEAVFVEGNMDVIASHQAGLKQVVASSGTALTLDQLRIVSRLTKNVKLAFDEDKAGMAATERAIELGQKLNLVIKIINLKGAKDPDELIRRDLKLWREAVAGAKYAVDYLFERVKNQFDLDSALGKRQFSDRMAPVISRLSDPVEREHYAKLVAEATGVSAQSVSKKLTHADLPDETEEQISSKPAEKPPRVQIEEALLALTLAYPDTRQGLEHLQENLFSSDERQSIWQALKESPTKTDTELSSALPKLSDYVKILGLRGEEEYQETAPAARNLEAFNLARRLQDIVTQRLKQQLSDQLKAAEKSGDRKARLALLEKYQQLIRGEY